MIRTIKIELNAAFPQMPLLPFQVFHDSAVAITVLNVPRRIVSLSVKVKNVSAVDRVFPARRSGSAWVTVIPGSFFKQSGTSTRGVKIEGVDEAGNIYTLGAADLVVMLENGSVEPVSPTPSVLGKLPLRALPKYLHYIPFDDTYPADAAWLYAQLGPSDLGRCSAVRRGGKLWRNYDWTFDDAAEFVVKMSGNASRFASVGVASVGSRLTENEVMSAVSSRYYKCLPGMTLDGINEKGVVCEINVDGGPKTGWHGDAADEGIHILAAVRWVLDHGETAAQAAEWLADHIIQPEGEMNFHFMVADANETWIVENGRAGNASGGSQQFAPVLTNFAAFVPHQESEVLVGKERYDLLLDGADIKSVWFTNAYQSGNDWDSDFESAEQHAEAIRQWAAQGTDKEAHRGKTTSSGKAWWQSVHTTEYDFATKTMKVAVQETDDWYVFAVPGGTGVSPVQVREIATEVVAPVASSVSSLESSKLDKTEAGAKYVPYNGATKDVDLGGHGLNADSLDVDEATLSRLLVRFGVTMGRPLSSPTFEVFNWNVFQRTIKSEDPDADDDYEFLGELLDEKANVGDIPRLVAPAASSTNAQAAAAKATYDFVNSSINAMAAFYITKNAAGDSFATKAELTAAIASGTFYNGGQPRTPTKNDYLYVLADESHPTAAGTNPTTRYSFDGTQWAFQIVVNDTALTAAQLAAMNSGINAALVTWLAAFKGTDSATTLASVLSAIAGKANESDIFGNDGKPSDTFATDLLGKQVAKDAIDERTPYALVTGDLKDRSIKLYDATSAGVTVTLPTLSTLPVGVTDFEAWIEMGATVQTVTYAPDTIEWKDGKVPTTTDYTPSATNIVHFTIVKTATATKVTACLAGFKAATPAA